MISQPLAITDIKRLKEILSQLKNDESRTIDELEMGMALKRRVRGQDHVVDELCRMVRLQWAKSVRRKPIANVLLLGPTGTGKSELCKALAEYLFGNEKSMLQFDCADFSGPEAKTRLIGTPGGYADTEKGGQLTRKMLNNPRRLVVFDEIEKAYPGVFDLFLSMMGDGRLTEAGTNKPADFTQSIIVLTSNAEHEAIGQIQEQVDDPHEQMDAVKKHLRDSKVFRPEIIGRFDRIYVFKKLDGMVVAEIVALKMAKLASQYGLTLKYVSPELIVEAMEKGNKLKDFGARELERVVDELLAESMLVAKQAGATGVAVRVTQDGSLRIEPA